MTTHAIDVRDLRKSYGKKVVLDGVDLTDVGVADVREALAIIPQVRGARALHAPTLCGVSER